MRIVFLGILLFSLLLWAETPLTTDPLQWSYVREGTVCVDSDSPQFATRKVSSIHELNQALLHQLYANPKEVVLTTLAPDGAISYRKVPTPFEIVSIVPTMTGASRSPDTYWFRSSICALIRSKVKVKLQGE